MSIKEGYFPNPPFCLRTAVGIHDQALFVDPANEVVIAKFPTFSMDEDMALAGSHLSGMTAIINPVAIYI